jgi:ribonuclease E
MVSQENQKDVVNVFQNAIKSDRARVQFGRISKFGLMEISRQRLRPSLAEANQGMCPRCNGQGTIRQVESLALSIIRQMRQESLNGAVREIIAYVPVDVATLLMNEKKAMVADLEVKQQVRIIVIPHRYLETPHYRIEKVYKSSARGQEDSKSSYMHQYELSGELQALKDISVHHGAAVETPLIVHSLPESPKPQGRQQPSLLKRLWSKLFARTPAVATPNTASQPSRQQTENRPQHSGGHRNRNSNNTSGGSGQPRRKYNRHGRSNNRPRTPGAAGGGQRPPAPPRDGQ